MREHDRLPIVLRQGSVTRWLCRDRRRRIGRDRDRCTRLQLELTDRHDAVAWRQPLDDFGAPVDAIAGLHEGADRGQRGLAVIALLLGDEEYRVAVKRVIDRG